MQMNVLSQQEVVKNDWFAAVNIIPWELIVINAYHFSMIDLGKPLQQLKRMNVLVMILFFS